MRFGLRAADDPRILNTIKVIDALLRVKLPQGPCWYRYNGDGYGEHEDGSPYDGTGIGRPWPLLAGERAHYEFAAGRPQVAEELLRVVEFSTEGGRLIPEQVGTPPIYRSENCSPENPRARRVHWCGRTRNTSSCGAPCKKEWFSINRLRRCSDTSWERENQLLCMAFQQQMPNHAAGQQVAVRTHRSSDRALELRQLARPRRTSTPATRAWAPVSRTSPRTDCPREVRSSSHFIGCKNNGGKARTSP